MTWQEIQLIILAVAAIGALVLLVTKLKVNAFIALIAAALVVGGGAVSMGLPEMEMLKKFQPDESPWKTGGSLTFLRIMEAFQEGIGKALASTAAIIALGIMLGKFLAESG